MVKVHKWGAYSPLPQPEGPYNHVVYPLARGIVRTKNGRTREMRGEELEQFEAAYSGHLAESFKNLDCKPCEPKP